MLIINSKYVIFSLKYFFFVDSPFDAKDEDVDVVKFLYCTDNSCPDGFTQQQIMTSIIDLTIDKEALWKNIGRNSRRKIKMAQNQGVKLRFNSHYEEFYHIFMNFKHRKGFGAPFGYDIPPIDVMQSKGLLGVYEYDGEIFGGALYFLDDSNIICWNMASKRLETDEQHTKIISSANNYLTWEMMRQAKDRGIKQWNWGGLGSEEMVAKNIALKGINQFKQSFGGNAVTRYHYEKINSRLFQTLKNMYGWYT